jgi:hypothetical protein
MARYDYAWFRSRTKAELALEDMFACGEVMPSEFPRIERRGRFFFITLPA